MRDLIAAACFCGKPISCEVDPGTFSKIYRHEVSGNVEELTVGNLAEMQMRDEVTSWLLEIHRDLYTKDPDGEEVRPSRVQYRFPDSP